MTLKVCMVLVAAVGVVMAVPRPHPDNAPQYGPPPPTYQQPQPSYQPQPHKEEPKPYAFDYGVQDSYSGANFEHNENSDGQSITGSYQVALPDGRIQKVSYIADHYNGFQAKVEYEGEAKYPETAPYQPSYPAPQPSYPAPQPSYRPPQPSYAPPRPTYGKEAVDEVVEEQELYAIDDPAPQEYL